MRTKFNVLENNIINDFDIETQGNYFINLVFQHYNFI